MTKRKSISKKLRFEIFKRDSFTCQYCGKPAPDVILEIDHINPISKGGENDPLNLITSCADCNRGKGAKKLDDNSSIEKQKKQLDELNIRREQLEMLINWRDGLNKLADKELKYAEKSFCDLSGCSLTATGINSLKKWIKKFSLNEVLESINISCGQYLEPREDQGNTSESINKAFNYIPRICNSKRTESKKPYIKDLYYIRGILRNRISYCPERRILIGIKKAYEQENASIDDLKEIVCTVKNWTQLREEILERYGVEL